jgi:hypothetical protein
LGNLRNSRYPAAAVARAGDGLPPAETAACRTLS